jgi:hypothetical protein
LGRHRFHHRRLRSSRWKTTDRQLTNGTL